MSEQLYDETGHPADVALYEKELRWNWPKFLVGLAKLTVSMGNIGYGFYTWFMVGMINKILRMNGVQVLENQIYSPTIELLQTAPVLILCIGWVVATVCLVMRLEKAVGTMISNAKLEATAKLNKEIKIDAAQLAQAVRGIR